MDERKLVPTLGKHYKLTLAALKETYRQIESKTTIRKIGLGVDEQGDGVPFAWSIHPLWLKDEQHESDATAQDTFGFHLTIPLTLNETFV